jgi:hypothetical protein
MKKRNRNTAALGADAEKRYGAIADATRQMQLAKSWGHALRNEQRSGIPGVKLHPGWDAAFRRAQAN